MGTPLYRWFALLTVLVGVFAISYVAETAQATQASYAIDQLKAQQDQLRNDQRQVRYDIAARSSAVQWDGDAARLGLVRSSQWQYVAGTQSPVALAHPDPTLSTPATPGFVDRLAIALGRPSDAQAKSR
jgi:outer membrane murein-binding lipoprotein Lpp